jgi:uncharacterized protein YndB with AHSA1/START domain
MSTPGRRQLSVSRTIAAPAEAIFAVLASPAGHAAIDGSGTVRHAGAGEPERLVLGTRFAMSMKMGVPYKIHNEVVEFEENRRIAWQHFGRHRWRYELEPVAGGTRVTETFDWSTARFPKGIELMRYPTTHVPNMEKTLARLDHLVTGS